MHRLETELNKYFFSFPDGSIARSPSVPRDSARLLVYDRKTGKTSHDIFRNLAAYIPSDALLVLNDTKVIPARFEVTKETGGKVRLLYLGLRRGSAEALSDRSLAPGSVIGVSRAFRFLVEKRRESIYVLKPLFPLRAMPALLRQFGTAPIPPYIKKTPLSPRALLREYQTIFARREGSSAAPTASLHFTRRLMRQLRSRGIDAAFVTLHVGLGTFAPVTEREYVNGTLHEEFYEISPRVERKIRKAQKNKRPIIAVGTTVVRALESWARNRKRHGKTTLFIKPGYRFRTVSGLITNFHTPRSSLLMLVSAFAGRRVILSLYSSAVNKKYRLFSFGDAMFLR